MIQKGLSVSRKLLNWQHSLWALLELMRITKKGDI